MPPQGKIPLLNGFSLIWAIKKNRTIFSSVSFRELSFLPKRKHTGLRGTMICGAYIAPHSDQTDIQKNTGIIYVFKVFATDLMGAGERTHEGVMEEVVIFGVDGFYRSSCGI